MGGYLIGAYGEPFGATGTNQTPYGFTGEPTDGNGLLYLRARYYSPNLGVFTSLDPFEGMADRPMSLNGYNWVEGNPVNWIDATGKQTGVLEGAAAACFANPACLALAAGAVVAGFVLAESYRQNPSVWNSIIEGITGTCTKTLRQAETSLSQLGTLGAYYGFKTLNDASVSAQQLIAILAYSIGGYYGQPSLPNDDQAISSASATGATITISTFREMITEASPSKGGRKFDLAIGKEPELVPFALSFGFKPITLPYLYWPNWMTLDIGLSTARQFFKGSFDAFMTAYFSQIPDGKLKLNLSGLDASEPNSPTTFEVWKLSTKYQSKTEYYKFENLVRTQLSSAEAAPIVAEILSTFSPELQPR